MIHAAWGPFLFDTSAESWFARSREAGILAWLEEYRTLHPIHISAVTVLERTRGYAILRGASSLDRRPAIDAAQAAYLRQLGQVWPLDAGVAAIAGEIQALAPDPPSPPKRSHRIAETRADRLYRWRIDCVIAATALVSGMPLLHNNPVDFESIAETIDKAREPFPGVGPFRPVRCALVS
jgi:predicted nucleic acid-binding protein